MSRAVSDLHPRVRPLCIGLLEALAQELGPYGVSGLVISTRRTFEEQAALWAQGRGVAGASMTVEGIHVIVPRGPIVTKALPGRSWHNYGLAFDVLTLVHGRPDVRYDRGAADDWYDEMGAIGERLGLEWGGRWERMVDAPHFQWRRTPGGALLSLAEARDMGEFLSEDAIA